MILEIKYQTDTYQNTGNIITNFGKDILLRIKVRYIIRLNLKWILTKQLG